MDNELEGGGFGRRRVALCVFCVVCVLCVLCVCVLCVFAANSTVLCVIVSASNEHAQTIILAKTS